MSRRRYVSTTISLDKDVNRLAREAGDFAALLYTWMIPHAEDSARITGDLEELLLTVCPGFRTKTEDDVAAALEAMDRIGLVAWDRVEAIVYFDSESFYRHQSYIPEAKRADNSAHFRNRRETPQNAEDERGTPQNAASLSPSPSVKPSPIKPPLITPPTSEPDLFNEFWPIWPNHHGSKQLAAKRFHSLTGPQQRRCIAAAGHMAAAISAGHMDPQFQPRAENFVGGTKCYYREWADGPPMKHRSGNGSRAPARRGLDVSMDALQSVYDSYPEETP